MEKDIPLYEFDENTDEIQSIYAKNYRKCLKSRILTNLSDVVQLLFLYGSVVQRKTYSTPIVQGNGGTHLFP